MVSCFRKKWQTKREKKTWRRARSRKITTGKKLRPYKLIRIWFWKNWVFYLTSKASLQNRRNFLVFFRRTPKQTGGEREERVTSKGRHAWFVLRSRLALASVGLKNAKMLRLFCRLTTGWKINCMFQIRNNAWLFFSPFKLKKSSPFRSPIVRFAAVVNPNCKEKSVFYSWNH